MIGKLNLPFVTGLTLTSIFACLQVNLQVNGFVTTKEYSCFAGFTSQSEASLETWKDGQSLMTSQETTILPHCVTTCQVSTDCSAILFVKPEDNPEASSEDGRFDPDGTCHRIPNGASLSAMTAYCRMAMMDVGRGTVCHRTDEGNGGAIYRNLRQLLAQMPLDISVVNYQTLQDSVTPSTGRSTQGHGGTAQKFTTIESQPITAPTRRPTRKFVTNTPATKSQQTETIMQKKNMTIGSFVKPTPPSTGDTRTSVATMVSNLSTHWFSQSTRNYDDLPLLTDPSITDTTTQTTNTPTIPESIDENLQEPSNENSSSTTGTAYANTSISTSINPSESTVLDGASTSFSTLASDPTSSLSESDSTTTFISDVPPIGRSGSNSHGLILIVKSNSSAITQSVSTTTSLYKALTSDDSKSSPESGLPTSSTPVYSAAQITTTNLSPTNDVDPQNLDTVESDQPTRSAGQASHGRILIRKTNSPVSTQSIFMPTAPTSENGRAANTSSTSDTEKGLPGSANMEVPDNVLISTSPSDRYTSRNLIISSQIPTTDSLTSELHSTTKTSSTAEEHWTSSPPTPTQTSSTSQQTRLMSPDGQSLTSMEPTHDKYLTSDSPSAPSAPSQPMSSGSRSFPAYSTEHDDSTEVIWSSNAPQSSVSPSSPSQLSTSSSRSLPASSTGHSDSTEVTRSSYAPLSSSKPFSSVPFDSTPTTEIAYTSSPQTNMATTISSNVPTPTDAADQIQSSTTSSTTITGSGSRYYLAYVPKDYRTAYGWCSVVKLQLVVITSQIQQEEVTAKLASEHGNCQDFWINFSKSKGTTKWLVNLKQNLGEYSNWSPDYNRTDKCNDAAYIEVGDNNGTWKVAAQTKLKCYICEKEAE